MYDYKCLTAPVCENTFDSKLHRCVRATADFGRDRRSDEAGPT